MFKNHITTVSPFQQEPQSGIPTLTKFKGAEDDSDAVVIPNRFGAIPIYQDKVKFVDFGRNNRDKTTTKTKEDASDALRDEVTYLSKSKEYNVSKLVEFSSYQLKNPVEKLFNVGVVGFQNLSDVLIEQILDLLINGSDDLEGDSEFRWSYVDDVDNKVVFFTLLSDDVKSAQRLSKLEALGNIKILSENLAFSQSSGLSKYIKDVLGEDFKLEIDSDAIQAKVTNLIKFNDTGKLSSTNDSSDYVIDETQLKDIPADVLPQLRKDIKDFRLKVIEIEKKKREKEKQEEIKRSKAQLRKLFDNFKKGEGDAMDVDNDERDEEYDEEDDGLTDEQFEEARVEKEKASMMRDYAVKLSSIRSVEHYNKELVELEQELSQYETNRDKTIKPEYEQGKFKRVNVNSEAELEKDARDREDEKKENELVASETPSGAKVPLKVSLKQKEEEEEEEEEEEKDQIEGTVSSEKLDISEEKLASALASIKDKIGLYLEELLGVGDEELTEYITMIIQDTKSKSALTEELKETFDEDADKISEAIWKDLLEAITV